MEANHLESVEANVDAEEAWSKHCGEVADATLFTKADSWYTGANIPGKTRRFLIYLGGVGAYRQKCTEIAEKGYEGFTFEKSTAPIQGSVK